MNLGNIKFYNNHGYFIYKNFLNKSICNQIKSSAKKLKPKIKIPFSKTPLGFGDVRFKFPFNKILKETKIDEISEKFIKNKTKLSHFMLVNKSAWIGPDTEWHQEVFNINMYAPGVNITKNWKKFVQVFIAIDNQNKENGCLKIFDKSHKAGKLKFQNIVNINGSHKRRVMPTDLDKLYKKYKIIDIELNQGDAIFFNHLLVHGSSNNLSPYSRLTALLQFYDENLKFNNNYFERYRSFRSKFVKEWHKNSLIKANLYKKNLSDFKK